MASSSTLQGRDSAIYSIRPQTPSLETISFNQLRDSDSTGSNIIIDTEESLNINILEHRENDDTFLVLLQALNENLTLKSWNFIGVIWSTREVEVLCNVVKRSSSLKKLSFQQSYLNPNGIKMLAEMLKKNGVIKALSFCKCDIRQTGASAIASALKTNKCLEGLQIWEDSIGSIGAEELAKMIEVNSSLRRLMVSDMQSIPTSSMVSATLGRNRNLELQIWNSESQGEPAKVVELIPSNKVLRIYRIDTSGSYRIACALARNNTIENMDISGNHINSKCAQEFRRVLQENRSLKHLNMSNTGMSAKSVYYIASALFSNHTLQSLQLERNPMGGEGIERLLCPLSRFKPGQQQANTSLKFLSIGGPQNKMGSYGVSALVQMISTNQSLLKFAINDDGSMGVCACGFWRLRGFLLCWNILLRATFLHSRSLSILLVDSLIETWLVQSKQLVSRLEERLQGSSLQRRLLVSPLPQQEVLRSLIDTAPERLLFEKFESIRRVLSC